MDIKLLTIEGLGHFKEKQNAFNDSKFATKDLIPEVDVQLSATSVNPVQNKVIKTALDEKAASTHTHADATPDAAGFMSATDKMKLDGIEEGANNFSLPTDYESNQVLSINSGKLYWRDEKDIDRPTGDKFGGIKLGDVDGHENAFYLDSAGNLGMRITSPLKFTSLGNLYLSYGTGLVRNEEFNNLEVENPVPGGGSDGQVLTKTTDGMEWKTAVPDGSVTAAKLATGINISTFTNNSGYQTASQVLSAIDAKLGSVYKYKGSVANKSALPSSGNIEGDVYNSEDTGMNYAWDGSKWDALGSATTLTDLGVTATAAELNYMSGVTSSVQTQLNTKAALDHTHTEYAASNHTHSAATISTDGFMSAADKTKLDNVADGANNYVLPVAATSVIGGVKAETKNSPPQKSTVAMVKIVGVENSASTEVPQNALYVSRANTSDYGVVKFASDEDFKSYMGIS